MEDKIKYYYKGFCDATDEEDIYQEVGITINNLGENGFNIFISDNINLRYFSDVPNLSSCKNEEDLDNFMLLKGWKNSDE